MIQAKKQRLTYSIILMMIILMLPTATFAGDAKGYIPAPDKIKGILVYTHHSSGNEKYKNGDCVAKNFNFTSQIQVVRPVYYFDVKGTIFSVQALLPFGNVTVDGADVPGGPYSSSGLADPTILFGVWPVNNRDSKTWIGFTQWFKMPVGEYHNERPVNIGKNNWAFKTEAGLVKGFGNFYLDIVPSYEFYTSNDKYGNDNLTQKTDPVFRLESHLTYDFTKTFALSLDHYFYKGGKTKLAGESQKNEQEKQSVQVTMGFKNLGPFQKLLVQYQKDVDVEEGPKTNKFGLRYTFLF